MSTYRSKTKCPKCSAVLFFSDDPLDIRGEKFCLNGHRFAPDWFVVLRDGPDEPGARRKRPPSRQGARL